MGVGAPSESFENRAATDRLLIQRDGWRRVNVYWLIMIDDLRFRVPSCRAHGTRNGRGDRKSSVPARGSAAGQPGS
jgi:hypothetical protein